MKRSLTALSLMLLTSSAFAQQAYSAKSLFFGEDDSVVSAPTSLRTAPVTKSEAVAPKLAVTQAAKKAAPKQIGASYFIRLKNQDGTSRDVLANRKFKSGEKFQLGVKVNRPTYVYIMNEDPDGQVSQIYPPPGQNNFINAMGTVFLPNTGSFEFDAKPGTEHLLVYLSPTPMLGKMSEQIRQVRPDMVSAGADAAPAGDMCVQAQIVAATPWVDSPVGELASPNIAYASKGIAFKDAPAPACALGSAPTAAPAYASKGIAFSDDGEPGKGGQVASYVVKQTGAKVDKSLYLKLKLSHE